MQPSTPIRTFAALLLLACSSVADGPATVSKDSVRALTNGKADRGGHDECQEQGWYGDGECDDFCPRRDPDCASDDRQPELGGDPTIVLKATTTMADALAATEAKYGPTIEAKYELDDSGALSLSVYPAGKGGGLDAERNLFEEASAAPASPWSPSLEIFHDQEHLTRSARDLTLVQLSRVSLADVVAEASEYGSVYWAIPTIQEGRAGYGVYLLDARQRSQCVFIDGGADDDAGIEEVGTGPGVDATDARTPELGADLTIVRQSRITMAAALAQVEKTSGPAIEAKFELGDDGKLSLSIYPVGKGVATDAERNTFFELAGDPTGATFQPDRAEFTVPDEEHLTRSARDLTLVQTARLTLRQAVDRAARRGLVFWAIPTIRAHRAGYGVYVLDNAGAVHYLFVS
jgi:hypothetical protein